MVDLDTPPLGAESIPRADLEAIRQKAASVQQIADRYVRLPDEQARFWTAHDALMQERKAPKPAADRLGREVKALRKRVATLETAIADVIIDTAAQTILILRKEIEARVGAGLRYVGTWQEGTAYRAGDAVTRSGAIWIARAPTTEQPGEGATSWQMAVKAGRNGRDAPGYVAQKRAVTS